MILRQDLVFSGKITIPSSGEAFNHPGEGCIRSQSGHKGHLTSPVLRLKFHEASAGDRYPATSIPGFVACGYQADQGIKEHPDDTR